jgi:hypothetical protein
MDAMGNAPLSKDREILHGATDVRSSSVHDLRDEFS